MLTALVQAIRRSGAEVLLSAVPSKLRLMNPSSAPQGPQFSDRCREWATAKDIPFVDLVPAFARAQAEGRPMFFRQDIHWTEQGHAVAGDALCRALGTAICR
jgi:lysophospholipase L1-like esterase